MLLWTADNLNKISLELVRQYWQRSAYLPFLDVALVIMKNVSIKKTDHFMNVAGAPLKLPLNIIKIR